LLALGFSLSATEGTAARIAAAGLAVTTVARAGEKGPTVVDVIVNKEISLLIITVDEKPAEIAASRPIRVAAVATRTPFYTTVAGAEAAVGALSHIDTYDLYSLQELHHTVEVARGNVGRGRSSPPGKVGSSTPAERTLALTPMELRTGS
jgi:carbamoyl-phosphate synthase large subunit